MPLDNIEFSRAAWKRLQTSFSVTKRPISLFIGPSADAAAASKTLRRLLQAYLIRTEIHIVENMDSAIRIVKSRAETYLADQQFLDPIMQQQQQSQQASQQVIDSTKEVAVFLGCGADRDLTRELDWSALTEIHVIDNCRPINLNLMRQAVASAQFLEAITENAFNIPAKPERCVFLWEQASAEQEADEFFWRLELAASRSATSGRFGRGGIHQSGRRRQRTEKRQPHAGTSSMMSDGTSTAATATTTTQKQQEKSSKKSAEQKSKSKNKKKNKKSADGGDDLFDFLDDSDDDEDDDGETIDTMSTRSDDDDNEEDDDDELDEDFIQADDESLGSQSDDEDDDDDDDEEKQLLEDAGAPSKKKSGGKKIKKSADQKKKKTSDKKADLLGGEDVEQQEVDDNDSWLASSDEDDDEDESSDDEDENDDGEQQQQQKQRNQSQLSSSSANNDENNQSENGTGDDDWSSVFTGNATNTTRTSRRSTTKKGGRRKKAGGEDDDDDDDDEEYYPSDEDDEDSDDDFDDGDDDDEDDMNRMDPVVAGQWRNEGAVSAQRERAYYSRYWASRSLGVIMHELSVRLEQADPEYVWHASIGLADLHQRGLISSANYEIEVRRLENAVSQFKNAIKRTQNGLALLADNVNQPHLYGNNNNAGENMNNNNNNAGGIMSAAPSSMGASGKLTRVRPLRHIKLFMLRHGSLWNALWLDRHVSAALGFHHISSGTARLEGLLAKIGMPRYEAELPWSSINSEKREAVLRLLYTELYQFGVADYDSGLFIPTLAKQVGYDSPVSAFDACHVFYGCIGAQPHNHYHHPAQDNNNNNNNFNNNNNGNQNGNHAMNELVEEYKRWQEDDYRSRFEAGIAVMGDTPEAPLFQQAINSAFELQAAAADATASILSGAGGGGAATLASTQHVRYVTIPLDHRISSVDHFAVPARLRTLALFLSAFTHNYRKNLRPKDPRTAAHSLRPLVIGVADAATSHLTGGNIVLGTVALVVAPALTLSSTSCTNASIVPSKVLSHYRAVEASMHMSSKFCGVHRDISLGTVVGADAIVEVGETLHLESVSSSHQGGNNDLQSMFFAA